MRDGALPGGCDALRQPPQLGAVQHLGVHHADQKCFDGAVAEPVHDALDGAARHALPGLGGLIDKGAVLDRVGQIALLFKAAEHGADGGVLERAAQALPDLLGSRRAHTPDDEEDVAFQIAQFGGIVTGLSVTRHSVTYCSTQVGKAVKGFLKVFLHRELRGEQGTKIADFTHSY